jgi:hypothetical protein
MIEPLISLAALTEEGRCMHHCVETYFDQVRDGTSLIFRVLANNELFHIQ